MKKWRKYLTFALAVAMTAVFAGCGTSNDPGSATTSTPDSSSPDSSVVSDSGDGYPEHYLTAVVPFGPTSGTDGMSRTICALAEQYLGQNITVTNMAGASGSVGSLYVAEQPADGYTLLTGSESTSMFHAMGRPTWTMTISSPSCCICVNAVF